MAADLAIHIWDKTILGEDVMQVFFRNSIGSKYSKGIGYGFTIGQQNTADNIIKKKYGKEPFSLIGNTPSYQCGETSPLKAMLFEDDDYLYGVDAYFKLFEKEEFPEITDEFIKGAIFDKSLVGFLEEHKGKTAFTVCW